MPRLATPDFELIALALGRAVGAALVLDRELSVHLATPQAVALVGGTLEVGVSAPKVLCAASPEKRFARALVEGRPVQALIPRPATAADQMLKVRSLPIGDPGQHQGWLLLLDEANSTEGGPILFHGMWTQSESMKDVFRIIERVAREDVTVLVRGETGTGKELVARAVHELSERRRGPFRALNCAALPANLLESELFGHVRGAFTGAVKDTHGHVKLADKGTLFLDEVGELPLELQAKLLRMLETRTVIPVGGRDAIPVDTRIVSATHRSLRQDVEAGRFRADLMYRLRVIPVFLPPLRERRQDIGLLCEKFIEKTNEVARRRIDRVSPTALTVLERYDWPGNVRELHNVLSYAYAIGEGPVLNVNDLPPELLEPALGPVERVVSPPPKVDAAKLSAADRRLLQALERSGGNRNKAARVLGVSRVTLWRRLKALGLEGANRE